MAKLSDEDFRQQVRYRQENSECEVERFFRHGNQYELPRSFGGTDLLTRRDYNALGLNLHHIFGRNGKSAEHTSNYIIISGRLHQWIHDHESIAGMVCCMYRKHEKGELDWAVADEIRGKSVHGWLTTMSVRKACEIGRGGLQQMRLQLLEVGK